MNKEFTEEELLDPKNTLLCVLDSMRIYSESTEVVIDGDIAVFPEYDLMVKPFIEQVSKGMVVLGFRVFSKKWDNSFYECCAGAGQDTRTAIGMAMGSFMFGFLQGAMKMNSEEDYISVTSKYADDEHNWKMYKSDIIGMGASSGLETDIDVYWNMLGKQIIARLGNCKNYYIKIFGSKYKDQITGEVRVNDVISEELSKLVASYVATWKNEEFGSQKQFFFFSQDEDTTIEDPYAGRDGYMVLKEKLKLAMDIYMDLIDREDVEYDDILPAIVSAIDDYTLAYECFHFLPEICTENAFRGRFIESESVSFSRPDKERVIIYKSQLSNYQRLGNALFDLFNEDVFGESTNDIYKTLIGNSSIASGLGAAMEDNKDTGLCKVYTSFCYVDGYIFR